MQLLRDQPKMSLLVAWVVIGFELTFPIVFAVGFPVIWLYIAIAFIFHIGCALVMGLDQFVWAFASTYPAILYVVASVH